MLLFNVAHAYAAYDDEVGGVFQRRDAVTRRTGGIQSRNELLVCHPTAPHASGACILGSGADDAAVRKKSLDRAAD